MSSAKYQTTEQKNRLKKTAAAASITLAATLCLLKTFGALYTGSLAVLSSMVDSLTDLFASSVTFIAVKISSRQESYYYRYGYGKAESLSALLQSAFITGSGIFILYDGFSRLFYPRPVEQTTAGIIIMTISLLATLALIAFQRYVTKITSSQAISADSAHYMADVMTNASIILSLIVVAVFQIDWFDTLTAFAVSGYLLYNALKIARDAVRTLMDAELDDDIRHKVKEIVLDNPFVKGLHDLRTRDLGGRYMFELHLELDGDISLAAAHDMTELVEDNLIESFPNAVVIIHQDPVGIKEDRLDDKVSKPLSRKKSRK